MKLVLPPDKREHVIKQLRDVRKRKAMKAFTGSDGLLNFVRYFWHVLEPQTVFVDGWPLEAICLHLEAVSRGEIHRLLINVPPGFMKGCADSTPILTPDGYRAHGELRVGDRVFGPDGAPTKVIARSKDLVADYNVELSTGEIIKCTNDHLWHVYDRWGKVWGGGGWKTVTTQWLATAKADKGRSRFFIPDTMPLQFPHRELTLHPYYLGCWLGDGTSSAAVISHDRSDRAHIDKLILLGYSVSAEWNNGGNGVRSSFGYQGIVDELKRLGVLGNKHIPEEYFLSSEEQRRELLAGLIDTDGTVDPKRSRVTYYTCDPVLAEDVQKLVLSLGMRPYVTTMDAPGYEEYSSDKTYFLIGFQPDAPIPTAIPRKQISRFDFARRKRAIVAVTKTSDSEMGHCITVDRADGLYVVGRTNVVTHNSLLTDVFWPAWEWAVIGSHLRYVTFSYSSSLTERDNRRFGALVTSLEYQELFGEKVQIVKLGDKMVSNTNTGWKLASSVGGVGTGERGDRVILDDPHNVKEAESQIVRSETVRWFRESMSNRLNDMDRGAIIIIMQRLHEDDVSGVILDKGMAYVHLMIPMTYHWERQTDANFDPIGTEIGWYDPRYEDYDPDAPEELLAWPERISAAGWEKLKVDIGPYAVAGQYDQAPAPRGGGIFKREWWQLWESPDGKFPVFNYLLASVDSAFTAKEQNDPTALTVWGIFKKEDKTRVMLVHAWRKFLEFSAPRDKLEILPGESKSQWEHRTQQYWGLVEWIKYSCERYKVDNLLIEGKASGLSAAQELSNRYGRLNFGVQLCPVKGDKEARALAAQPTFSQGIVYAPAREWAEEVITEMAVFPKGKYMDLTDSTTQAIRFMRVNDLLVDDDEAYAREMESLYHPGKKTELTFW